MTILGVIHTSADWIREASVGCMAAPLFLLSSQGISMVDAELVGW